MMDLLCVALNAGPGRAKSGAFTKVFITVFLCLLAFKPLVWVMKITGIFSLLQWMNLINEQGYFSFEVTLVYLFFFAMGCIALTVIGSILMSISGFLVEQGNKHEGARLRRP